MMYNSMSKDSHRKVVEDVYDTLGITATAGIAPNLSVQDSKWI